MADPIELVTENQDYFADGSRREMAIKNAIQLQIFAFAAVDTINGRVDFAGPDDGLCPAGLILGNTEGDNPNGLLGDAGGNNEVVYRGEIVLKNVSVLGVAAATDVLKLVYASDGQTLTLTQGGLPQGIIVKWRGSTRCDVYLIPDFLAAYLSSVVASPTGYFMKKLATIGSKALSGSTIQVIWQEISDEHYEIVSLHAQCVTFDAAAVAGAQTLNLDVGGTDTTGGVLSLGFAECNLITDQGVEVDASAITAANEVHIGDAVSLEVAASGTGFTLAANALFEIYARCKRLPGV